MLRWLPPFLALLLAALGTLHVFKAPAWVSWKFVVLANGFGPWLSLAAGLLALVAVGALRAGTPVAGGTTLALALVAAALLLRPAVNAARLAATLPERFDRAFGSARDAQLPAPFSWPALFSIGSENGSPETLTPPGGLPLDFYRATGRSPAPCVVVIHGGGWDNGDRTQLPALNRWLAAHGYAVAAITYRLAPRFTWPAPREDLDAALAFLTAQAAELGIDPTRFVLLGRSAGGQIAEAVGYESRNPAIRGVIALYAPADLEFAYRYGREDDILKSPHLMRQYLGGPPDAVPAAYESASAYFHVTAATPPTLLIHGELDTLVWHRQSERLDAKLTATGVPHVFVSLPWATHAFDFAPASPGGQLTTYAVARFLAACVR